MSAHGFKFNPTPIYDRAAWDHGFAPKPADREPTYGMCTACGSVEVRLDKPNGTRDLSGIGEHHAYPVGYGCEVCS